MDLVLNIVPKMTKLRQLANIAKTEKTQQSAFTMNKIPIEFFDKWIKSTFELLKRYDTNI